MFRIIASVPAQPSSVAATESDAITICGDVTVTQPTDATVWTVGETGRIEWDVYGKVDNVKITYSKDGGSNYLTTPLIVSTPADNGTSGDNHGYWDWAIPTDPGVDDYIHKINDPAPYNRAMIKVEDTTSFGAYVYDESLAFIL